MERLYVAAAIAGLAGWVAYRVFNPPRESSTEQRKPRKHGRGSVITQGARWKKPEPADAAQPRAEDGASPRVVAARRNVSDGQSWSAMAKEAEELRASGRHWRDDAFPHDDGSLFVDPDRPPADWLRDGERGKVLRDVRVEWHPPPKFCATSRPLGRTAAGASTWLYSDEDGDGHVSAQSAQNADDVVQGSLGDCYLLSALALATRDCGVCEDLIDATFEDAGAYGVTLFVRGRWTLVFVDGFFPCWIPNDAHGRRRPRPVFASAADHREIWPMVVEKAFAKLHGSYEGIGGGGVIATALTALTGGAAWTASARSIEWPELMRAVASADVFVGAGSRRDLPDREMRGLVGGHAYSILHAVEVVAEGAAPARLLLLRNPWAHGEWKGDWGVGSRLWSRRPDVVAAVGNKASREDDGRFWISLEDFRERFASVDLCRIEGGRLKARNVLEELRPDASGDRSSADRSDDAAWLEGWAPAEPPQKKRAQGSGKKKKKHGK